ncbi:CehA/McbA family metallohydrolase [Bacillus niameyensis]|uniref:CehA/McbA family metallohydrolase n=1 Tax=Bacillus niameyensis TaxID=1522308 RepID=UPI000785D80A|nr:CehA/McbA family metallohydrolase [Bacillus niameyensis]
MANLINFEQKIDKGKSLPLFSHCFILPDESEWIAFTFNATNNAWLLFLVFDADRTLRTQYLRGNSLNKLLLHKEATKSSALTVPGELPGGEWLIQVVPTYGSNNDLQQTTSEASYEITVESGKGGVIEQDHFHSLGNTCWVLPQQQGKGFLINGYDWEEVKDPEEKWYRGDFHTHTIFSDGKMTRSGNNDSARNQKLDFFVATDHNIVHTSWSEEEVLIIPGIEVTTSKGHWNILGVQEWPDIRPSMPNGGLESEKGMKLLFQEVKETGALCSVNHPFLSPWAWQFTNIPLSMIDSIEIWNDPTYKDNPIATEHALNFWSHIWNEGYHITGIGGSDSHLLPHESYNDGGQPSLIGDPATYVHALNLSASAILDAVKQGKVFVSRGPFISLSVSIGNQIFKIGDEITAALEQNGYNGRCTVTLENGDENIFIYWIENGEVVLKEQGINSSYSFNWKNKGYSWLRVDVRSAEGQLLAFSNPIYYGNKNTSVTSWGDLLKKIEM